MENQTQKMNSLNPDYIAGFTDGEGCFGLQFRKDVRHERPGSPSYFSWKAQFTITARKDEQELFERIKDFFNCGNIYKVLDKEIHFCVSNIDELYNIISPFFKKYQLQGKKKNDFILWDEAVNIIYKNKKHKVNIVKGLKGFCKNEWDKKDLNRLIEIHSEMQKYKSLRPKGFKHIKFAQNKFVAQ